MDWVTKNSFAVYTTQDCQIDSVVSSVTVPSVRTGNRYFARFNLHDCVENPDLVEYPDIVEIPDLVETLAKPYCSIRSNDHHRFGQRQMRDRCTTGALKFRPRVQASINIQR
jgi:hypothetical protein